MQRVPSALGAADVGGNSAVEMSQKLGADITDGIAAKARSPRCLGYRSPDAMLPMIRRMARLPK